MINKQKPKIVVGVIVYNDNDEIFLAKSYKWNNKWIVPGGHLEWGETLFECVKREVKEETNLEVSEIELVDVLESILSKNYHKPCHMVFVDYCCKATSQEVRLNEELQEYIWIKPRDALEKLNLNPATKDFVENFINKK